MTFSLTEALQFAGIIPSFFVIIALLVMGRERYQLVLPILYFFLLAVSFTIPLHGQLSTPSLLEPLRLVALFFEACLPVASFLLIMQFLLGRPPRVFYWLSFAIPLIGGAPFIYGATVAGDVCVLGEMLCTSSVALQSLYALFTTSFLFLLLVLTFSRVEQQIRSEDVNRHHKYWLIISLISMNLVILIAMLAELAGRISYQELRDVQTIVRLSFIYLVITSLFRVFGQTLHIQTLGETVSAMPNPASGEVDPSLIAALETALRDEKLYRKMGISRQTLASHLGVGEHVLSKTINSYYQVNFNELVNGCRIDEAKERLAQEDTAITVIAFEVGFNSIASFNRVFKHVVGSSATEYRNKQK